MWALGAISPSFHYKNNIEVSCDVVVLHAAPVMTSELSVAPTSDSIELTLTPSDGAFDEYIFTLLPSDSTEVRLKKRTETPVEAEYPCLHIVRLCFLNRVVSTPFVLVEVSS